MKKLKLGLFALALLAGVSGAVVTKVQAMPKQGDPTYDWVSTASAPDNPNSTLNNKTVDQATRHFGCSSGSTTCANGTLDMGSGPATQILKQP